MVRQGRADEPSLSVSLPHVATYFTMHAPSLHTCPVGQDAFAETTLLPLQEYSVMAVGFADTQASVLWTVFPVAASYPLVVPLTARLYPPSLSAHSDDVGEIGAMRNASPAELRRIAVATSRWVSVIVLVFVAVATRGFSIRGRVMNQV